MSSVPYQVFELPDLPADAPAMVTINADDSATIFVSRDLCPAKKAAAILHELEHLEHGDFWAERSATELEEVRHD